jgi:O-Antigen ligase
MSGQALSARPARVWWEHTLDRGLTPFMVACLGTVGIGASNGGYFPSSWGWPIVAFAAVAIWVASAAAVPRVTRAEAVFAVGLLALAIWYALSAIWGVAGTALDQSFRPLVYAAGVAAAIVLVRAATVRALLAGVLTGASAIATYALGTRLYPDRIGTFDPIAGYRLATPIGYWNALGLLCSVGLLLSIGLVASTRSPKCAALAALPAPVLVLTLYFTFSRGSWISLAAGLAVALALDPRRVHLTAAVLALAMPSAIGVALASSSHALTHEGATVASAAHDGHRLGVVLLLLVLAAGALGASVTLLAKRVAVSEAILRGYAIALGMLAAVAVIAALAHLGGPAGAARRTWDSFAAPPPKVQPNLQARLFSFSGNYRADLWRIAWRDFRAHPLIGSGAGSYQDYWLQHRTTALQVKNAHSLYLETLAELGIVGFTILLVALAAPLVAAWKMRKRPGIAIATGAYVAYLVGASVDWDWQLTAVTLAALFVGVALLASARPDDQREASPRLRYAVMVGAAAVGAAGFVFLVGNLFLSRSSTAAADGNWAAAARDASRASDWLPWSTAPLDQLGNAQLGAGDTAAARVSFRKAIAKDPSDWNLWFDLARASTGRAQAAAIARATRLDPLGPEIASFKSELGSQGGIGITVGK